VLSSSTAATGCRFNHYGKRCSVYCKWTFENSIPLKRGTSNASAVDLTAIWKAKWTENPLSLVACKAMLKVRWRLFGQFRKGCSQKFARPGFILKVAALFMFEFTRLTASIRDHTPKKCEGGETGVWVNKEREGGEAGVWVNKGPETDSSSQKAR
jgi:hypothetical protein